MPKTKVAVTLERRLLDELDALVDAREYPNRSQAIEAALADALARRSIGRVPSLRSMARSTRAIHPRCRSNQWGIPHRQVVS